MDKGTFVVGIAEWGYGDDFNYDAIYVGDDVGNAKGSFKSQAFDKAIIHIYKKGKRIKTLEKNNRSGDWKVTLDLVTELADEITELQAKLREKSLLMESIIGGENK